MKPILNITMRGWISNSKDEFIACVYVQKSNCVSTEEEDIKDSQNLILKKVNIFNSEFSGINIEMGQIRN